MFKHEILRGYLPVFVLIGVVMGMLLAPAGAWGSSLGLPQADVRAVRQAEADAPVEAQTVAAAPDAVTRFPYSVFLPMLTRVPLSDRLGFGGAVGSAATYAELSSLKAGWYFDWSVKVDPVRLNDMDYVQVIRVHQKLTCPLYSANAHNRSLCPYAVPHDYVFSPDRAQIEEALRANRGALWMIGNEMDRRDWAGGGQDEMLPETYAVAYHDLYALIKSIDPAARVAIGGVIQATPLRLEYLTKAWNAYQQRYGGSMPVDVWNVHNFILKENINDWGASIPPGSSAQTGVLYPIQVGGDGTHVSLAIFDQQIRAFRQWMKARGQQHKPLIVSEYGVLYHHIPEADTPQEVQDFMVRTFEYFLETRDCSLGSPTDDCRLAQRWAWYSLDDNGAYSGFNRYGALFDPVGKGITGTGARFRLYSLENMSRLSMP